MHAVGNAAADMRSLPAGLGKTQRPVDRGVGGNRRQSALPCGARRLPPTRPPCSSGGRDKYVRSGCQRFDNSRRDREAAVTERPNIELKAVGPDPDQSLAVCRSIQAADRGVIQQRLSAFAGLSSSSGACSCGSACASTATTSAAADAPRHRGHSRSHS